MSFTTSTVVMTSSPSRQGVMFSEQLELVLHANGRGSACAAQAASCRQVGAMHSPSMWHQ